MDTNSVKPGVPEDLLKKLAQQYVAAQKTGDEGLKDLIKQAATNAAKSNGSLAEMQAILAFVEHM